VKPFWRATKARWILPYLDGAGVQHQHVIPPELAPTKRDRAKAAEYARGWLEQQKSTGTIPARPKRGAAPPIRALRDRWLEHRRSAREDGIARYKPSTLGDYEEQLDSRILAPLVVDNDHRKLDVGIGDVPLDELDAQRLRAWVRALRGAVSSSRCRNVFSTARSLVDDAIAEGWAPGVLANPLRLPPVEAELPPARRASGLRPIVVEADALQAVIGCPKVPEIRRVRWLVQACVGLSEGELAGRAWSDFELGKHPLVEVTTSLATRGPEGWASMGSTKNEHRVRTIPLHREAAEALRWWYREGWADYVGRPPRPEDPVFPGREGGWSRPASAAQLRADLQAAGQSFARITAQALRRAFSTLLDTAGVAENVRGRLMGHAAKSVTGKHYTAAALERDRAEVEKIPLRWVPVRGDGEAASEELRGLVVGLAALRGTWDPLDGFGGQHDG
jgi:integrase